MHITEPLLLLLISDNMWPAYKTSRTTTCAFVVVILLWFCCWLYIWLINPCPDYADPQRKKRPNTRPTEQEYEDARKPPTGPISEECPEPDGFFADAYQCDKYYQCVDGKVTEKLCPDGLVFIDAGPKIEKCEVS